MARQAPQQHNTLRAQLSSVGELTHHKDHRIMHNDEPGMQPSCLRGARKQETQKANSVPNASLWAHTTQARAVSLGPGQVSDRPCKQHPRENSRTWGRHPNVAPPGRLAPNILSVTASGNAYDSSSRRELPDRRSFRGLEAPRKKRAPPWPRAWKGRASLPSRPISRREANSSGQLRPASASPKCRWCLRGGPGVEPREPSAPANVNRPPPDARSTAPTSLWSEQPETVKSSQKHSAKGTAFRSDSGHSSPGVVPAPDVGPFPPPAHTACRPPPPLPPRPQAICSARIRHRRPARRPLARAKATRPFAAEAAPPPVLRPGRPPRTPPPPQVAAATLSPANRRRAHPIHLSIAAGRPRPSKPDRRPRRRQGDPL